MHRGLGVAACVALGACATGGYPAGEWGYCAPPEDPPRAMPEDPVSPNASRVERIAALLGVTDELREAQAAPPDGSGALGARLVLLEQVAATRTILEATVAELDCERERSVQIAAYLQAKTDRSTTRFTLSSVLVGAATAIASGVLVGANANDVSQEVVAVSGGALAGTLAIIPLFDHPRMEIRHERNALADVWFAPRRPAIIPEVVWAYLARPAFSNSQTRSIRENIVARWKEYQLGDGLDVPLLFGAGGWYDAASLNLRGAMLDQVKAEVRLMNQDLAALLAAPNAR
jgi:hypothetical protein